MFAETLDNSREWVPSLRYCPSVRAEGLDKTTKTSIRIFSFGGCKSLSPFTTEERLVSAWVDEKERRSGSGESL
ncbi:hypothetical protein L798_05803 [Zootermopsis nevadensis]|uniref:Uncharacterized protein n=1 Tax=Zootermopsis nevadensis TaxID=136037 RepID=A0A067RUC1_ZOONE|nr:hypothetical protein L798_05803 [Zootermopsis nevadensis]